jgi:tetratricopeptide (TPR) repeat protein
MNDSDELRALAAQFSAPARKGLFGRKLKGGARAARLDAARRFAQLAMTGEPDAATLDTFARLAAEFPADESIRIAYAGSLAGAGRDSEAINEYEEGLALAQGDARSLTAVAILYERSGRADLAIERLHRAVDLFVASQELDAAVDAARRLITLEPSSLERASDLVAILRAREPVLLAGAIEHLANVYREREKLGQEADACRELLTLTPERDDVKTRLAAIYTRILEVDPDDCDAWFGLASVDESLAGQLRVLLLREDVTAKETGEAKPTLEGHSAYANRKAQELIDAGDILGACLCLERAVSSSGDPSDHLRLAQCYQTLHRGPQAVKAALRAIAVARAASNLEVADEALGWLGEVQPEAEQAIADAVFLNHRPESADILYEKLLLCWDEAQAEYGVGALAEAE